MRFLRVALAAAALPFVAGCGYIHFGRLPQSRPNDTAMAEAFSNLTLEHKILKQELALARKEGDALRLALDRATGAGATEFAERLNETTRELATLRANYAKLQSERAAPAASLTTELEAKLAASLEDHRRLQEENARLRTELDHARAENTTLAENLKAVASKYEQAQAALRQLNLELLTQKQARARAEQATDAVRAQLSAVLAQSSPAGGTSLAGAREAPASSTSSLDFARPSGATAELSTGRTRSAPQPTPPARKSRTHVVQAGDTFEKLARDYYGAPERWREIYEANAALLSDGQPLRPGMELQIPQQ